MGSHSTPENDLSEFDAVYPELVKCLFSTMPSELNEVSSFLKRMTDYSVPHGKKNRGLIVRTAYRCLVPAGKATAAGLKQADIAGWCIEWMQASFLVHDDLMDNSTKRRGQPCWYTVAKDEGLGLISVNDGIHLGAAVFQILKAYFQSKPYYIPLVGLYQDCLHRTCIGQCLDMLTSPDRIRLEIYTLDRYRAIVKWKTAYYSFYLPIAAAMIMNGVTDKKAFDTAEQILLQMGEYFQIQDDYLDCYGDSSVTGKVGTDVEEGKCSWLVVQALERVTPDQRKLIEDNYGRSDPQCVARVKALYSDLDLRSIYNAYEESSYQSVTKLIQEISSDHLPKDMFHKFAQRIYKRTK